MKSVYIILGSFLLLFVTMTTVSAEVVNTPKNPENTIENKLEVINQMVESGELDEATAEEIKENLSNCDGSGEKNMGQKYNLRFGKRLGNGDGNGQGKRHHQN